jgi:hypothetical protein
MWRAQPGSELALEGGERAANRQFSLALLVAAVPVELVAVQRLPALGARRKCRPRLVHIHPFENVRIVRIYSGIGTCNVRHKGR